MQANYPALYMERDVNGRYIPKQHPLSSCPAQGVPYSAVETNHQVRTYNSVLNG